MRKFISISKRCFAEINKDYYIISKNSDILKAKNLIKIVKKMESETNRDNNNTFSIIYPLNFNFFGQTLLYLSPIPINKAKNTNLENSGVVTLSAITIMNYYELIFPSLYLFPYFTLITSLTFLYKYFSLTNKIIYNIILVDNHTVKVSFFDGKSELVPIKNIFMTSHSIDRLSSVSEAVINFIDVRIMGSNKAYNARIFLINKEPLNKRTASNKGLASDRIECIDLYTLLGILNANTKRISLGDLGI